MGIQKEASHTFTEANNRHLGDQFLDGLTNAFVANENTVKVQAAFTWAIEGSTAAGVGTYTVNEFAYHRHSGRIWFSGKITWTAHTGTGNLLATIPQNMAGGATFVPLDLMTETIAYTASRFPAAAISTGNQRINLYQFQSGGALAAIALPAAGTVYVSGSYPIV